MHTDPQIQLQLANERIQERIDEAARARHRDRDKGSLRRSVGQSMIRIGERLAAEPSRLRPARLR